MAWRAKLNMTFASRSLLEISQAPTSEAQRGGDPRVVRPRITLIMATGCHGCVTVWGALCCVPQWELRGWFVAGWWRVRRRTTWLCSGTCVGGGLMLGLDSRRAGIVLLMAHLRRCASPLVMVASRAAAASFPFALSGNHSRRRAIDAHLPF